MAQATDALYARTLTELARGLKEGEFSSRELTESLLQRIDEHQARLNTFITVTSDVALQRADAADKAGPTATKVRSMVCRLCTKTCFAREVS